MFNGQAQQTFNLSSGGSNPLKPTNYGDIVYSVKISVLQTEEPGSIPGVSTIIYAAIV